MRRINERYCEETFDENGVLKTFKLNYPDNYNFAYDIVDGEGELPQSQSETLNFLSELGFLVNKDRDSMADLHDTEKLEDFLVKKSSVVEF